MSRWVYTDENGAGDTAILEVPPGYQAPDQVYFEDAVGKSVTFELDPGATEELQS